ncbi:putative RNA polymerase II transcription factor SIII subunit A [Aspergillus pseudotamarii]|uniref:Putative RNA polymerase II transcription factor SIII subunit A n=1 Tax=Aspergillus pseudotamarii TaxID=132259 RepID=A0A5N6SYY8_ASPPS|nr:putative RNA polymerase II transcription factor SIII subunit A [Aspergillus pseudotamarii]KAE8138314.1 putative RNA polymerase II transcription factor SIII subunit A [Aspergillus pseudotamarii]
MPPPSLLQLCTATAVKNVKYLNDIGNVPYILARPFLLKIESPEKLRTLELQSPHIIDEDKELWLEFIKRDIPRWDEYDIQEQSDCWYDVYCDLRERVQREVDEDAEKLKLALDGISSERAKNSVNFVPDRRDIRLPRERPTAKQRYASYDRKMGGIKPMFTSTKNTFGSSDPLGSALWSLERPPPPPKKKSSIFTAPKRNNALAVPTKHLNNRATQVRQAPRSLVEEHRRPPEPAIPRRTNPPALRAPGRSNFQSIPERRSQSPMVSTSLRDREARLRAIASGQRPGSNTPSSSASSQLPPAASSRSRNTQTPTANSRNVSSVEVSSLARSHTTERHRSAKMELSTTSEEPRGSPAQAPRPAMIRKRPPPNVFMQPKKRKVN